MTEDTVQPVLALLSSGPIDTDFGEFNMSVFHDGDQQAVVLSLGDLDGQENVLCRVHSECISAHVFLSKQCDCRTQMIDAQERIQKEGQGIIIFLEQEGRGHGAAAHVSTLELKRRGIPQDEAYRLRGFQGDARHYDIAAKIIRFLGINSIILMSSSKTKNEALEKLGVVIKNMKGHSNLILLEKGLNNLEYYINEGQAIPIWKGDERRVFIIGDLMVDYNFSITIQSILKGGIIDKSSPVVGGTALNAAKAIREKNLEPIVFGKVGDDNDGRLLIKELKENHINALIAISKEKPTGCCHLIFLENMPRTIIQEIDNANDYDLNNLVKALNLTKIEREDIIFLAGHPLVRQGVDHARKLINLLANVGAGIILDIVPHNMSEKITFDDFKAIVRNKVRVIIAEYQALRGFINYPASGAPTFLPDIEAVVNSFNSEIGAKILIVRYGEGNIEKQTIWKADKASDRLTILEPEQETGYTRIPVEERRGFGDKLTAAFLSKYYNELTD